MCKACKMDPHEVKIFRARQGAVEIEDFDDEPRYHKAGHGTGGCGTRKKRRQSRGCPANNNGAHVYVWTSEREITDIFFNHFGFHKKESKVCCGCGVIAKSRETEEYMKRKERAWRKRTGGEFNIRRGEPVSRYRRWGNSFWGFSWEMFDPEYKVKYEQWHEEQRQKWLKREAWYPFPRY